MGLSKKERQEKREAKLAEKRTAKRSERNALRGAIGDYVAGAAEDVIPPEPKGKRGKAAPREAKSADAPPAVSRAAPPKGGALHLEEVGPCRYEISPSARPFMRVPGVVIAGGKLLDELRQDPALEQLVNMTALPGIVGSALAMPDCHWGYGFPVGGVAAMRVSDGVVSPGGVGYDINCLPGNALILHELGYRRPIADLVADRPKQRIVCIDSEHGARGTEIVASFQRSPLGDTVLKITTESGRETVATADHPFQTPAGMVPLGQLNSGDRVAIYPFEGVEYEPPPSTILVDEATLAEYYPGPRTGLTQIVHALRERGLLPLTLDHPKLPYLVKLLGFVQGDGSISFLADGGSSIALYGEPEDLEDVRRDVERIGFTPSRIYQRDRAHSIDTQYGTVAFVHTESAVQCRSTALAVLLTSLGATSGSKARQPFSVPHWLEAAARWLKRLFLAALFGAELTAPQTVTNHPYNFYPQILSQNKVRSCAEAGRHYLERIRAWLTEFEIESSLIADRDDYVGKDGDVSIRLRLQISGVPDNLIRLWSRVGFEYNRSKRHLAAVAIQYLRLKQLVLETRQESIGRARALHRAGHTIETIVVAIGSPHVNRRFVERSVYDVRATPVRVGTGFPGFSTFLEEQTKGLGETGQIWDRIIRLEPLSLAEPVYDLTVADPNHNFVADGFVVSNCGVRLLRTPLMENDLLRRQEKLADALFAAIPSGIGVHEGLPIDRSEIGHVLAEGVPWAVEQGFGTPEDLTFIESGGRLPGVDPDAVSKRAIDRGFNQLGTLGSGNHFFEVQVVDEIYDATAAAAMGLAIGQVCVFVHSGSRGLGHQVCQDYLDLLDEVMQRYEIKLPDRQLACAPINSPEGQRYLGAMRAAANYAFVNRQGLTQRARDAFRKVFGKTELAIVYDVAHNVAKEESYVVDGKPETVLVHRKGATRAFPAGNPEIPARYAAVGQPVLIPGDMGRYSFVAVGTEQAMRDTFGSICHGAGRHLSRSAAKKELRGADLVGDLKARGILVRTPSPASLAEEASLAYKDVADVVDVCERAGIARKVARLRPRVVVKG
jgi:tRNA-splicing ligase RtcB